MLRDTCEGVDAVGEDVLVGAGALGAGEEGPGVVEGAVVEDVLDDEEVPLKPLVMLMPFFLVRLGVLELGGGDSLPSSGK